MIEEDSKGFGAFFPFHACEVFATEWSGSVDNFPHSPDDCSEEDGIQRVSCEDEEGHGE